MDGYKALIFDMDGTLIDSMGYWRETNLAYLGVKGLTIPEEFKGREMEVSGHALAEACFGADSDGRELEQFFRACEHSMIALYPSIPEKPGALAFLRRALELDYRMCVATASPVDNAMAALEARGMLPFFELVVTTREVGLNKHDGAFFLRVAEMLGLEPSDCLVFEDALYAIESAKQAGMDVFAIAEASMKADEAEIRAKSDRFFSDYAELMEAL